MGQRDRLWNRNFLLLWQGQLVSTLGDAVYRIALGFWILAATGSTALMGAVMATTMVPRVLLSPLAGTLADRADRKWLLVLSDAGAGLCVLLLGAAALYDAIEVWMVFVTAAVLGCCSALFDPAAMSTIADLVPKRKLTQANSAFAMLATGAAIAGNAVGGFLYQALGAALLFVINGASFLVSASSELLLRVPPVAGRTEQRPLLRDLRDGLRFVWAHGALRVVYLVTAAVNVFSTAVFVLLLPLFHQAPDLDPAGFGLLMASLSAGAFGGFLATSVWPIKPHRRFAVVVALGLVHASCFGVIPWLPSIVVMLPVMGLAGCAMSVQGTVVTTALQLAVPGAMRGKAFGLRATLMLSLGAVATAAGGTLAEHWSPAVLITAASIGMATGALTLSLAPAVRKLLRTEAPLEA